MFCTKCGAQNYDDMAYCVNCGTPLHSNQAGAQPSVPNTNTDTSSNTDYVNPDTSTYTNPAATPIYGAGATAATIVPNSVNNKYRTVGMIAVGCVAAIVVIVAAILIMVFTGRGYKSVVKQYINAVYVDGNPSAYIDLLPDDYVDYYCDEYGYSSANVWALKLETYYENSIDNYESTYGSNYKVTYKITGDVDIIGNDLADLKMDYMDYGIKISRAKSIYVKRTFSGSRDEDTDIITINAVKIGRSWYYDIFY